MFRLHLATLGSLPLDQWLPELDIALTNINFGKGSDREFFQLFNGRRQIDNPAVLANLRDAFPAPGNSLTSGIVIGAKTEFSVWLRLATRSLSLGEGAKAFIPRLSVDDEIVITALDQTTAIGNVIHRSPRAHNDCEVRCADGTSSQGCVTCTADGVTIKLCC